MSGFTVADLIKPNLESMLMNSSQVIQSNKDLRTTNIAEDDDNEGINAEKEKNTKNEIHTTSNSLQTPKDQHQIGSEENDVLKKSTSEIKCVATSCSSTIGSTDLETSTVPNFLSPTSNINTVSNQKASLLSSPIPFNYADEIRLRPLIQAYSEPSLLGPSFQNASSSSSSDVTFIPTVISASSPFSSSPPSCLLSNNCTPVESQYSITNANTEEHLQILLKLHNLFGINITEKSNLNEMNSIHFNHINNNNFNKHHLSPNNNNNNNTSNTKTSLLHLNDLNSITNINPEIISPFNSPYMMSVMMNSMLNKEQSEQFCLPPSVPLQQEQQQQQQPQQQAFPHRLSNHHQEPRQNFPCSQSAVDVNSQMNLATQSQLIANFLKSRLLWDNNHNNSVNTINNNNNNNNGGKTIFQDISELVKLDNTNLPLNCYDHFIKDSMHRNVLITSDNRKPKRIRTAFSPSQLFQLESAFEKNHYVVGQERKDLANDLNLTETQVKVWFQNRRTKYKRLHTDGKDVISNSSSKERRSASDGEDDDVDDDDNGEDENEGDVEQEEAEDTFKDLSCNQNQLRVEYNHEILAKHSKTDSSNQINIKAFAIQHNQSSLDNKDFNFTTDCHSQHNLLRSNNLSDNKGINDLSYNPSGKLKAKRAYPKCEWSSFKQISSNLNTENRLETHHLPANQSILHSSHNLLHSVLGHINQIKNAH